MGPGGVVWGKKTEYKKSRETVPLSSDKIRTKLQLIFRYSMNFFISVGIYSILATECVWVKGDRGV